MPSMADSIVITITLLMVYFAIVMTAYFWDTRRRPIRRDAPTHGSWVKPKPFR